MWTIIWPISVNTVINNPEIINNINNILQDADAQKIFNDLMIDGLQKRIDNNTDKSNDKYNKKDDITNEVLKNFSTITVSNNSNISKTPIKTLNINKSINSDFSIGK